MSKNGSSTPPKENLVRAITPGVEIRSSEVEGEMPTMAVRFAVFDTFTEIDSLFEGRFLERIAKGAFKKTFREQRDDIKVLLNHGKDPSVGNKPLGPIRELREEDDGAHADVPLIDTSYNRDILPALEAGLYGASFRFRVVKEELNEEPERSETNPSGLPERTITELRLFEFGPVTFPAYADATAGVRSLTDERAFAHLFRDYPERMRQLFHYALLADEATEDRAEDEPHSDENRAEPDEESTHSEQDEALSEDEAETQSHSVAGSRANNPLVLPKHVKPRRAGVLPSRDEGDEEWTPIRLP